MISEEEINLWLKSNRLVVMQIDDYISYRDKNIETAKQLGELRMSMVHLPGNSKPKPVHSSLERALGANKKLKKKHIRLKRRLERLKTEEIKQLLALCSLAMVKNGNRNTQPQTP